MSSNNYQRDRREENTKIYRIFKSTYKIMTNLQRKAEKLMFDVEGEEGGNTVKLSRVRSL